MYTNFIKLNYISYYKLNDKQKLKNIFYYIYVLKKYNKVSFNYFKLPSKKKYFCFVKSPKCYKVGKILISYSFFKFFFFLKIKNTLICFNNILKYFLFLKRKYIFYQTIFSKNIKITIQINTKYYLKILYGTFIYYYLYYL